MKRMDSSSSAIPDTIATIEEAHFSKRKSGGESVRTTRPFTSTGFIRKYSGTAGLTAKPKRTRHKGGRSNLSKDATSPPRDKKMIRSKGHPKVEGDEMSGFTFDERAVTIDDRMFLEGNESSLGQRRRFTKADNMKHSQAYFSKHDQLYNSKKDLQRGI